MQKNIHAIVADDNRLYLKSIESFLNHNDINVIAVATNGKEVLKSIEKSLPDIVVTDINMPEMDGIELTKQIRKKYPWIKILALSMFADKRNIDALWQYGINGYLLKGTNEKVLLEAIKEIINGKYYFSEEIKKMLTKNSKGIKENTFFSEALSLREIEILKLIVLKYSNEQIADKLFISPHTVIFHKKKLLHKFGIKNTPGLIKSAMDKGLLD